MAPPEKVVFEKKGWFYKDFITVPTQTTQGYIAIKLELHELILKRCETIWLLYVVAFSTGLEPVSLR